LTKEESPLSPGVRTPQPFVHRHTSLDLDDYFVSSLANATGDKQANRESVIDWSARYSEAFEMAHLPTDAR
jgi:hypothetical protein